MLDVMTIFGCVAIIMCAFLLLVGIFGMLTETDVGAGILALFLVACAAVAVWRIGKTWLLQ
jgi:hypothetical protein